MESKLRVAKRTGQAAQNFDLINGLLDEMVKRLATESKDDEAHKEYCEHELQVAADNGKNVQEQLTAQTSAESELKDQVDTIAGEIETLKTEIAAMDASVALAS